MRFSPSRSLTRALLFAAAISASALADNWTNLGGNHDRNGRTNEIGPDAATPLWSGGRSSIIAWAPMIDGNRVFMVRQTGFPPGGEPNGSPVVAMNLTTGGELWHFDVPYDPNDWTTWIAGARDGHGYASRSGNGASVSAKMYAIDQVTGGIAWVSVDKTAAGAYDGVVFADNGDLIVADFRNIRRIRASDGTTAWTTARVGSVSGDCGAAVHGDAVYIADAVVGGNAIKRYNINTGAFQYQSPVLTGFTIQNTPFVGADGTVYLARVQNNVSTDFFYAINDDGSAMTIRWSKPAAYSYASEGATGPDGSVYMWAPGNFIERRAAADGALLNITEAPVVFDFPAAPHITTDALGRVYFSNGGFSHGAVTVYNADLTSRYTINVTNINQGGPAIGANGVLVVAGVGTDVRAYRNPPSCPGDLNGDHAIDLTDLAELLSNYGLTGATPADGDLNGDTLVDLTDLAQLLSLYGTFCP